MKTIKNQYGLTVKCCCASCGHKDLTRTTKRMCMKKHRAVDALDVCDDWMLSDQLKNAGKSRGVVRDIETKEIIID